MTEQFEIHPAKRSRVPLLIGLVGPSGTGKTFSALRLATGIQRAVGGKIAVVDTEARRALAYADLFTFDHLAFGEPFGPLRYLAAGEACIRAGATTVIFDSMSHEHEGPGGVLEIYEKEIERLAGNDWDKRNRMSGIAWNFAKGQRKRMINTFLQLEANLIFCFRAQEKLDWGKGRKNADGGKDKGPTPMGWQPITDTHRFMYEMTVQCLLLPGSDGTPTWRSDIAEERAMVKLPKQFRELFAKGPQLNEDIGEKLARWAAGDQPATAPSPPANTEMSTDVAAIAAELMVEYAKCTTPQRHAELEEQRKAIWKRINPVTQRALKEASTTAPIGLPDQVAS